MAVSADTIYQLIKSYEGQFPVPAPFVTINVGTFDASTGAFNGLTTAVEKDPEPVEHTRGQRPTNPPPKFVGETFVTETIDAQWKRTITTEPAPKTPLNPVMLQFAIANATSAWSVNVNGLVVNAPATQTTIQVAIWDSLEAAWTIQAGSKSHTDKLRVQRPAGVVGAGVGAFTIPVLPVTIVYAPPADSTGDSVATYTQGQTVGTTVTTSFGQDSSKTVPNLSTDYGNAQALKGILDTMGQALGLSKKTEDIAKIVTDISTQIGQFTSTTQTGISDLTESTLTLTQTTSDAISANAKAGGTGEGDVLHFFKNVRMAWAFLNGRLRLSPLGAQEVFVTTAGLKNNPGKVGISQADAQLLLNFDPFVAGGPEAGLPADRYTFVETWEYGFGVTLNHTASTTRDTKSQTTHKTYTTDTTGWDPGPIFLLLGLGEKNQTTVTVSNATGSDVSQSVTMSATLASGQQDYFVVSIWYDTVFGTFAFQQTKPVSANRFQGTGASPGQLVTLKAGGSVFRTVADKNGHFVFRARSVPAGAATLTVGSQPPRQVTVPPLTQSAG